MGNYVEVPQELLEAHKEVEVCMDVMFIDGIAFLNSIVQNIKAIVNLYLPQCTEDELLNSICIVIKVYNKTGLRVK